VTQSAVEVSAFEAKTRLSELLRETERGREFVIRRRGKAVARLVPVGEAREAVDPRAILADFRRLRQHVTGKVRIRELIDAGRRR
jgi:prevent-host-death family protein